MKQEKMKKWLGGLAIIVLSVGIAGFFSAFLNTDFSSIEMFAPVEKKMDFQVTDIYNMMAGDETERNMSQDVAVVLIDSLNREELMSLIDTIKHYEPKAIGLDIYFSIEKADNKALIQTIENTPNMVNIVMVEQDPDSIHYVQDTLSFFYDSLSTVPHSGFANLDANYTWTVIRTFVPYVLTRDGDTIPNFALELAKIAAPERAQEVIKRGNTEEIIDFSHYVIDTASVSDLLQSNMAERIKGKVVLIGVGKDPKDTYLTPMKDPTPGVLIHAYATQTILQGEYIETRAAWKNWAIAVCMCLVLVSLLLFANESEPVKYGLNLSIRLLTFIILMSLVFIGSAIFARHHIYVDYTPAIKMLVFGMLAFDLVYAGSGLFRAKPNKTKQTKSHKQ